MLHFILLLSIATAQGNSPSMSFGPPQPFAGYGGKMSNVLDLYPDGFASNKWSSADGGRTFQISHANASFFSDFAFHTDAKGHRVAHDFGTGLVYVHQPKVYSVTFNATSIWEFQGSNLTRQSGADITFEGLPHPVCGRGQQDWISPHASGHIQLSDGTHLHSTIIEWCDPPYPYGPTSLIAFQSKDGLRYTYVGNVITSLDVPESSEGPNEHDMALLGNGDVLCVSRMGAGDGRGGYMPLYKSLSKDGGKTWSKAEAMPDIGCARPELVQLDDNITILSAGRSMMRGAYSRSFSVWASTDHGQNWTRADGSYHHNAKAAITRAPLWPADCNRTGWRFQYTSGYVGLVRVGPKSAMVIYDYMPPLPPPPPRPPSPPRPPGHCTIHIHHTLGCFNDADGTLILPHLAPAPVGAALSLESCGAACYALKPHANFTVAGVDDGKSCFCGAPADMETAAAKAKSVDKAQCTGTPCGGDSKETECGGPGRLLAYSYSCDADADANANAGAAEDRTLDDQHNPPYSFAMRIDVST